MITFDAQIRKWCAALGRAEVNPRHVEAWLRVRFPVLGEVSAARIRRALPEVLAAIDEVGPDECERMARGAA